VQPHFEAVSRLARPALAVAAPKGVAAGPGNDMQTALIMSRLRWLCQCFTAFLQL